MIEYKVGGVNQYGHMEKKKFDNLSEAQKYYEKMEKNDNYTYVVMTKVELLQESDKYKIYNGSLKAYGLPTL